MTLGKPKLMHCGQFDNAVAPAYRPERIGLPVFPGTVTKYYTVLKKSNFLENKKNYF